MSDIVDLNKYLGSRRDSAAVQCTPTPAEGDGAFYSSTRDEVERRIKANRLSEQIGDLLSPIHAAEMFGEWGSSCCCLVGKHPSREAALAAFDRMCAAAMRMINTTYHFDRPK